MTILTEIEILQKAQELIRDPEHWTQRQYAATKVNRAIGVLEEPACKFCTAGAVARILNVDGLRGENSSAFGYLDRAAKDIDDDCSGAVEFNDLGTHDDVMAMFDRAITAARAEVGNA